MIWYTLTIIEPWREDTMNVAPLTQFPWKIDDSNEWLIGRMEDEDSHGGAQDDFVFNDDNLTWGDVARTTGAEEARFGTRVRARASLSIIPPTKGIASSFRTLSLIH